MTPLGRRFAWLSFLLVATLAVALVLLSSGAEEFDPPNDEPPEISPAEEPARERDREVRPPELVTSTSEVAKIESIESIAPELPDVVRGRVLDPFGNLVVGARVTLTSFDLGAARRDSRGDLRIDLAALDADPLDIGTPSAFTATTETDPDGRFEFRDVAAPEPQVFARHRDRLVVTKNGYDAAIGYPLQRRPIELRIEPEFMLMGSVRVDATDEPIANAVLVIEDASDATSLVVTRTDEIGRFAGFPIARTDKRRATIYREGYGPLSRDFKCRDPYVEIEMASYPTCVVHVRDAGSRDPLGNATVRDGAPAQRGETRFEYRIGETDGGGDLRILGLESLRSLVVDREGYCSTLVRAPPQKGSFDAPMELNVELLPATRLIGRFVDSAGRPLEGLRVSSRYDATVPLAVDAKRRVMVHLDDEFGAKRPDAFVTTDPDGRFELRVWPRVVPIQCGVFDPKSRVEDRTVTPMATGAPGKVHDLGEIALRAAGAAGAEAGAAPADPGRELSLSFVVVLEDDAGKRLSGRCIEIVRKAPGTPRTPGTPAASDADTRTLLGFGFTDPSGTLRVSTVGAGAPAPTLAALHCDGFEVHVVFRFDPTRTEDVEPVSHPSRPCFVDLALTDAKGKPPDHAIELRFREEGKDSEFLPYLWSSALRFDATGHATIALPLAHPVDATHASRRFTLEARSAESAGAYRLLGSVAPGIEQGLDASGRWIR